MRVCMCANHVSVIGPHRVHHPGTGSHDPVTGSQDPVAGSQDPVTGLHDPVTGSDPVATLI